MNQVCIICMNKPSDHLIDPCGHACLCSSCIHLTLTGCPICRVAIQKTIKIFHTGVDEPHNATNRGQLLVVNDPDEEVERAASELEKLSISETPRSHKGLTIGFKVKIEDADDPSETNPYITICDPSNDLANLLNPDEIVIPRAGIMIEYKYPFSDSFYFEEPANGDAVSNNSRGFTRSQLAKIICERYQKMYKEEKESSQIEAQNLPGMLNRCQTDGIYGIWGHDISDLLLFEVYFDPITNICQLSVDS